MPDQLWVVVAIAATIVIALHVEWRRHRRAVRSIPIRIHVNGTRGKSSVTRLIAATLREHGIRTLAKTTGTTSRIILPDGSEEPIERSGPANVGELTKTMIRAAKLGVEAVVFECMAVHPDLQRVAEERIVRPTLTVITNARLDHTDVQGATPDEIAASFPVRPGGSLVTADLLVAAVRGPSVRAAGGTVTVAAPRTDVRTSYVEHPENVGLAMKAAKLLGVPADVAARGISRARPDPGAASVIDLDHPTGSWTLVNLFAANDPDSTFKALETVRPLIGPLAKPVVLFVSRGDRTARSVEFAAALAERQERFSSIVIWGDRTKAMIRRSKARGVDPSLLVDAGTSPPARLTDLLVEAMNGDRVVVGIGNIVGRTQDWLDHLASEAGESVPETAAVEAGAR